MSGTVKSAVSWPRLPGLADPAGNTDKAGCQSLSFCDQRISPAALVTARILIYRNAPDSSNPDLAPNTAGNDRQQILSSTRFTHYMNDDWSLSGGIGYQQADRAMRPFRRKFWTVKELSAARSRILRLPVVSAC